MNLLSDLPFIHLHIDKVNLSAWICHVASNRDRVKETLMNLDINERDISQSHFWLSLASPFPIKWIQHTSRSISIRLFHLLRPDINSPPNWSIHSEIPVIDVSDIAISLYLISRISLDINSF